MFQFAIFYNGLLEFTWCAPMTINGRVHANANMYTGTSVAAHLQRPGHHRRQHMLSFLGRPLEQRIYRRHEYNANYSTNWQTLTLPLGTHQRPIRSLHMPPPARVTNQALAQQSYFNKADLVLLVSNSTVSLTLKTSPSDPRPTNIIANYYPTNLNTTNYVQITTNFPSQHHQYVLPISAKAKPSW